MTVPSDTNHSGPYSGNGSTTVFGYGFRVVSEDHIRVIKMLAGGEEVDLVIVADYTVSGVGDAAGGSITAIVAPAAGEKITIIRNVPFVQETDLENQGAYYAETVEDAIDLSVMRDQQLQEQVDRSVKIPASYDADDLNSLIADVTRLADSADNVDTVADNVDDVNTVAEVSTDVSVVAGIADEVVAANGSVMSLLNQSYVGDGVETGFTLPAVSSTSNVIVWVGGARQVPVVDYTVSDDTLTMAFAPDALAPVDVTVVTAVSFQDVEGERQASEDAAAASELSASRVDLGELDQAVEGAAQSASDAAQSASDAAQSASDAEGARDAAFTNSDVYADIATGRAAVADDEQFIVVDGVELVRYRRDSASTQTEMARVYSSDGLVQQVRGRTLCAIMPPLTNGMPNLNLTTDTLEFYADTIFFDGHLPYVLTGNVSVDLTENSSSAKVVWFDVRDSSLVLTAWSDGLTGAQDENFLLVALIRTSLNAINFISMSCQYEVNGVDATDQGRDGMVGVMLPSSGAVPNYNTQLNQIEFASDSILFHRGNFKVLPATNVALITNTTAVCVYYSWSDNDFSVKPYNYQVAPHEALVAVVRRSGINSQIAMSSAWSVDGILHNDDGHEALTPIIPPSTRIVPDIRRVGSVETLFIPNDTLLFWRGNLKILPETTISLDNGSSTKRVFFNFDDDAFTVVRYNSGRPKNSALVATIRMSGFEDISASMACPYSVNGIWMGETVENTLDAAVKAVAHRGYSSSAPENTLTAYRLAKEKGFSYCEVDLVWSSDDVPMCIHDQTIDRTSNGTGRVDAHTEASLKTYDFGSWKHAEYAGEQIPNVSEFLTLCKKLSIHPYLEVKQSNPTQAQIDNLVQRVARAGMKGRVSYICASQAVIAKVLVADVSARVGLLGSLSSQRIADAVTLSTSANNVFLDVNSTTITEALANECHDAGIDLECYTVNNPDDVSSLVNKGVSGITTDGLNISRVLKVEERSNVNHT